MVKMRITNLGTFESQLRTGGEKLSKAVFQSVSKQAERFIASVPEAVSKSSEFKNLQSDDELRGKLGLALPALRRGGDTDAEDLLKLLSKRRVKRKHARKEKVISIRLPSIPELEQKLTHRWTRIRKGRVISGPINRWFRWWEYGDRGENTSLTVLRSTISSLIQRSETAQRAASRSDLLQKLIERSRSGAAIQRPDARPNKDSRIKAAGLIRRIYGNYNKTFAANINNALKKFVKRHGGRADKFYARRG